MEINVISGALYTQDGKKIADVKDSSIMLVDEPYKQRTMEVAENIGKTHSITCQLAPYDMRMVYSLMYGMKITNNFLKMHGGIMVFQARRVGMDAQDQLHCALNVSAKWESGKL